MRLIDADLLGLTDMEIIMCDGDYKEALKMLMDKIEHAPTIKPEQRWIPCSENSKKLPEDRQRCLVTIRDGREPEVDIVRYATDLHTIDKYDLPDSKPGWYGFDSEYGYYEQTGVTAWMPLPEPYREEGEK